MKIKKHTFKVTAVITAVVLALLFLLEATPMGYDRIEFDLTTGQTRYVYRAYGITYRTTPPTGDRAKTPWLARNLKPGESHAWVLLSYLNYGAPRINTSGGKLVSKVRTVGQYLECSQATPPAIELIAEFICTRLRSFSGGYSEADQDWAELEYVFDNLYDCTSPDALISESDVRHFIETAKQSVSP
jgi:hypothetical protein